MIPISMKFNFKISCNSLFSNIASISNDMLSAPWSSNFSRRTCQPSNLMDVSNSKTSSHLPMVGISLVSWPLLLSVSETELLLVWCEWLSWRDWLCCREQLRCFGRYHGKFTTKFGTWSDCAAWIGAGGAGSALVSCRTWAPWRRGALIVLLNSQWKSAKASVQGGLSTVTSLGDNSCSNQIYIVSRQFFNRQLKNLRLQLPRHRSGNSLFPCAYHVYW